MIGPEGMASEPAHDLAIPLRHWNAELLEANLAQRVRSWCSWLQDLTGVASFAIWEWAFAERVETGLFLLRLGDPQGQTFLAVAEARADSDAPRQRVL